MSPKKGAKKNAIFLSGAHLALFLSEKNGAHLALSEKRAALTHALLLGKNSICIMKYNVCNRKHCLLSGYFLGKAHDQKMT